MDKNSSHTPLLRVKNLSVDFHSHRQKVNAVENLSFDLEEGKTLAIVGESGSGKSVTGMSIPRLIYTPTIFYHQASRIEIDGEDVLSMNQAALQKVRREKLGYIFQEPMTALNPLLKVGTQVAEAFQNNGKSRQEIRQSVLDLFEKLDLPNPTRVAASYAHQLSGGQRQRVVIAIAIATSPKLLIADEPTTALDVTVQASILDTLKELKNELNMAMLFISHDLGVVSKVADDVLVMHNGLEVERNKSEALLKNPTQNYTKTLLASVIDRPAPDYKEEPVLLSTKDINVRFEQKSLFFQKVIRQVHAVKDANIKLETGQSVGLVGESGSGKSTLARSLLKLNNYTGNVLWNGFNTSEFTDEEDLTMRREIQMVFQDPYSSLSPRNTVGEIVAEGLKVHRKDLSESEKDVMVEEALEQVKIPAASKSLFIHEFSGGQRQRIAIARALVLRPKLVIMDEPTSALDATVQKSILELLEHLQSTFNLSYFLISHDLSVVRALCSKIYIMHHGQVVEEGVTEPIYQSPQTDYAKGLLSAAKAYSFSN